VYANSVK